MRIPICCCLLLSVSMLAGEALADLDLSTSAASNGRGLTAIGVTWTTDGLFLPAAMVARVPRTYPPDGTDFPAAKAPYRVDLALPGLRDRSVTVTMLLCLASATGDQDNLFSIGRRSRWFSGQVGTDGRIIAGLDNRWRLLVADRSRPIADRRWHALSLALGDDRSVRVSVDGEMVELRPGVDTGQTPPRAMPEDEPVLSLADPGSARHVHGLVRRLIVHRGQLDRDAMAVLHRQLAPASLPQPQAPVFLQALRSSPAPLPDVDDPAQTGGVSDF